MSEAKLVGHSIVLRRAIGVLLLILGLALDVGAQTYTPPATNRVSTPLSGTWRFLRADSPGSEVPAFDDSSWSAVTVPHTWNAFDGQDGPQTGGNYYRGVGRYRRHVTVPAAYAGRRVFLQFDGANIITDVWVNGLYVGHHEGGYTTFRFDVTAAVNTTPGADNVIAVKVDNTHNLNVAPLSGDFTSFGGLYRDVSLVTTDPLAGEMLDYGSAGVYLTQTNVSQASASLEIKTSIYNAYAASKSFGIKAIIVDAAANIVNTVTTRATLAANSGGSFLQNATIVNPRLWDGKRDPYLYSVYVEIHDGDENGPIRDLLPPQPLGLRSFYVDPNQGFFLNGRALDLRGVNRHQDRLDKGWAISQNDQDEDMRLIEEIGATAVRLAHYPHAQYFYSLADRNGMIVWAELPFVNGRGGQAFALNLRQQLIELIRQSYNHPAIVFWSLGNEIRSDGQLADPTSLLTELNTLAKQEDPYRLTTLATCCVSDTDPTTTVTDTIGYNKYFGWYTGGYADFAGWADAMHAATPNRAIAVSEYGAGASIFLHPENPWLSAVHNEVYQANLHEAHWLAMKTRPFLWGKFVWNMFDFASDSRTEGDTFGRNDKGLVTFDRQTRKDAFYWYKANWTTAPMVYITSRRWVERTVPTIEIKVYANTDSVELMVNGVSLGTKTTATNPHRIFAWPNVTLGVGANTVQAIARTGTQTVTDTVTWNVVRELLPPTIATPASASPSTVTNTTTALSVLGADDGGESHLSYTWTTTGTAPTPVSFSVNGTNAAKNTVASFMRAGSYTLQVTVRDSGGRTVTSSVTVSVAQTLTTISVSPTTATVVTGSSQQFTASAVDQFATAMSPQPPLTWTVSGGGIVNTTGLFTAGTTTGTGFTITASASGRAGTASVSVVPTGGFSASINFQLASAPPYPGYLADGGAVFGDRGNGLSYGWSQDASARARDRNSGLSPDQRYDTLIHMDALTWEIAVPNGSYSVRAVVGDPSFTDVNSRLTIEGVLAIDGQTSAVTPWLQGNVTVTISDGRLTIGNQAGSYNKICFVEIVSIGTVNQPPLVGVTSPVNGATFTAPVAIALTAGASDLDGTVTKVEFFDGGTKLGEDLNGADGWGLTWPNVPVGAHTLTARATDNRSAATVSSPVAITVLAPAPASVIRLDIGSNAAFTDSGGNVWSADQFANAGIVSTKPNAVENTLDDDLYRTYRYGSFAYAIPVIDGTYDVSLAMMETWWDASGKRLFSVSAEGSTKLANLDLYAIAGKFTAIERTFTVTVTDGVLNLSFTATLDHAIVSAIAVVRRP